MMRLVILATVAIALEGCSARPVVVQPPLDTEADIAEAERLGRIIFVHDTAAAQATDELIRIGVPPTRETGVIGWITVPDSSGLVVRFVGEVAGQYSALYDVGFSPQGRPWANRVVPPLQLPPVQMAAFEARQLAIASAPLDCSDRYNTVVFQDPVGASNDWHVYLLPATTVAGRIMVGRQQRFIVSADSKHIVESRALSKDCMYIDRSTLPPGAKEEAFFTTSLVSPIPNESHVFLSLHERLPFAVATSLGTWIVVDGKIRYLGPHNEGVRSDSRSNSAAPGDGQERAAPERQR